MITRSVIRRGAIIAAASAYMIAEQASGITLTEVAKLLAEDGAPSDAFGFSVALSGDTAVVGLASGSSSLSVGGAYVFRRTGATWSQEAKLLGSDVVVNDSFGYAVAVSGDTVIVGAPEDDDLRGLSGSAFVFTRSGTTWTEQAKLLADDGENFQLFGIDVAVSGDTALIGVDNDLDTGTGAAFVFVRNGTTWSQQQKLLPSDGALRDNFGRSVALFGETAVVGSPGDDDSGDGSGSAYVFSRIGTAWSQQAKLSAGDGAEGDAFGFSVDLSGDAALISAPADDDNGVASGSAYVFARNGTTWTQQAKLLPSDGAEMDFFGTFGVSVSGDTAVIGARSDDDNGTDSGSAYVFTHSGAAWLERAKLLASDGDANDMFGRATAVFGDTVVVGAYGSDFFTGSAYVYTLDFDDEGPVTSNVLATPNPVAVGTAFALTANIDDTGTGDSSIASATYTIDSGAGAAMTAQDGSFDETTEVVTALVPAFAEAGVHSLCVSGIDSAGNTGAEECTFLAAYDPADGFVTGGGWIDSPPGALVADPTLAGRATFGFVSKYQKGRVIPSGNTQFQFKAGDLDFHSDTYEWLVIAGSKAQYKGSGTINGVGNYGFMLFAIDADESTSTEVDLFRIKIWDQDNADAFVYDNEVGATEDADPTTELGGGSIMIHTNGR